jgi:hypothetical protein
MSLAEHPGVSTVVYAAYWESYLRDTLSYFVGDSRKRSIGSTTALTDRFFAAYESELEGLASKRKRVVVILSNPTIPIRDVRSSWPRRVSSFAERMKTRNIQAISFLEANRPARERLLAIQRRVGIDVIDPVESLCQNGACPTITDDSVPIFRDTNHLRSGFVQRYAVYIDGILERR